MINKRLNLILACFFLLAALLLSVVLVQSVSAQGTSVPDSEYTIVGALPGWGAPEGVIITRSQDPNYHILANGQGGIIDLFPFSATSLFTGYPNPAQPLTGTAHGFRFAAPSDPDPIIDTQTGLYGMPATTVNDLVFHVLISSYDGVNHDHWIQLFHDATRHEAFVYLYMSITATTAPDAYGVEHTGQHDIYAYQVPYDAETYFLKYAYLTPAPRSDYPWPDEFLPLPAAPANAS